MAEQLRLGDILVQQGLLSKEQLEQALAQQQTTHAKLGNTLIDMKLLEPEQVLEALAKQLKLPVFDLRGVEFDPAVIKLLPEGYARRFRALVLDEQEETLTVGVVDPLDLNAIDELKRVINRPIDLAIVREDDLLLTLDMVYRRTEEISGYAQELQAEISEAEAQVDLGELSANSTAADAPVIKLLQSIFEDAAQVSASDIHIEPGEHELRLRLRVDGVLQEQIMPEKAAAPALALRLKLIAGLNIAERRLPQDGRFHIKIRDKDFDVRLSTLPNQHGESIVMRLLDQADGILDLEVAGMPTEMLAQFRHMLKSPHGVILVTGPTGSGKTTTLYGALNELNQPDKKIITAEDPVEYRLPRLNQVQVNDKLDFSFARVLRSMLRQDPDIILVGEMRDQETANIAMKAALTGHLVLSTLHTNDAASSAFRLVDMGVPGYLVAATLRGVLAQRLVRRLCEGCRCPAEASEAEAHWLKEIIGQETQSWQLMTATGCQRCNDTGFKGRVGVFELLTVSDAMMTALRDNDATKFAEVVEREMAGRLLRHNALRLVEQGVTSVREALRIAGEGDD